MVFCPFLLWIQQRVNLARDPLPSFSTPGNNFSREVSILLFYYFYYLWERFYAHIGIAILFGEGIYILAWKWG